MAKQKRRKFSPEFKKQVVGEVERTELSKSAACRKYRISFGTLNRWIDKFQAGQGFEPAPSKREKQLEKENQQLKEKMAELYLQNELLKKAQNSKRSKKSDNSFIVTSTSLAQSKKGAK